MFFIQGLQTFFSCHVFLSFLTFFILISTFFYIYVNLVFAEGDDLQLDAVLEGSLDRAEEESSHDGVGDYHAGETDVGEEERGKLLTAGHEALTLAALTLSSSLAVEHLPRRFTVQVFHRHVNKPRDCRAGNGRDIESSGAMTNRSLPGVKLSASPSVPRSTFFTYRGN